MIDVQTKTKIEKILDRSIIFLTAVTFAGAVYTVGFQSASRLYLIEAFIIGIIVFLVAQEIFRLFITYNFKKYIRQRKTEFIYIAILIALYATGEYLSNFFVKVIPGLTEGVFRLTDMILIQLFFLGWMFVKTLNNSDVLSKLKLYPGSILAVSFAITIIFGTLLLSLPEIAGDGKQIGLIDALFTATSAVCVTGLSTLTVATDFSLRGQIVIMALFQIGGLGVMTLTSFFATYISGGISLKERYMLKDLTGGQSASEVRSLLFRTMLYTFVIESVGISLLYLSHSSEGFDPHYLFFSIFHGISAFCNAGFSLYPDSLANSEIFSNYLYLSVIMLLIVVGGLGFVRLSNINDLIRKKSPLPIIRRLSLTTKTVLLVSGILIVVGFVGIIVFEPFGFDSESSFFEKGFHALFQSVTARTAGFNTLPIDRLAPATLMILMGLMWIGASPGSTGGGIKTTTFAVTFLSFAAFVKGRSKIEIFGREVSSNSVRNATGAVFASLLTLGFGTILLTYFEPDKAPLDLIFESVSAIGTVGLSRGITPKLGDGGKIVIILMMFVGRIGALTFFAAFFKKQSRPNINYPNEEIIVL